MNINNREVEFNVNEIFPKRWSPRAMSGEDVSDENLKILFEAARWEPSSYNNQPWRFIYAKKGTEHWSKLFDLLAEPNQAWCKNAGVLVVTISRNNFEFNDKPTVTHTFDAGSAWMSLALQGSMKGLVVHGMEGFDKNKAKEVLEVPDNYSIEMMFAIGQLGKKEDLSEEMQKMELQSDRKKVSEIISEGKFVWK